MIPQRMFISAPLENELRERVSACRKRLRENRVAQRAQGIIEFRDSRETTALTDENLRAKCLHRLELEEVGIT